MHAARNRKAPQEDGWLTVPAAAAALGLSAYLVRKLALHGDLKTALVADRTVVSRASVEAYKATRPA